MMNSFGRWHCAFLRKIQLCQILFALPIFTLQKKSVQAFVPAARGVQARIRDDKYL
jgi:hypothetical protein